jgi:hypothetical protein
MNTERRAILSLLAMGRITPREAERLLAAWSDTKESVWMPAACLVFAAMAWPHAQELPAELVHLLKAVLPGMFAAAHHALSIVTGSSGGLS